eukprot:TRINITY_DN2546_c0_g1_i3.p1 TRINITY_DN2546_c0_g1~~TRINITY_DN2546_c0_g1_i3.p1  ORF type:complete len:545 (-),score=161.69 TRINITY_DN2546_c0_g1_i3:45-1679(-)
MVALDPSECPVTKVTVFTDRAEATRTITRHIPQGTTELALGFLPQNVDHNSVRIAGVFGSSILLEVTTQYKKKKLSEEPAKNGFEEEKEVLVKKVEELDRELNSIDRENDWLKGYASSLLLPQKGTEFPSEQKLSEIQGFITFYGKQLRRVENSSAEIQEQKSELNQKLALINEQIFEINTKRNDTKMYTEVVVALEASEETDVVLEVSYLTRAANWKASYDVRVNSENKSLEASYYGNITNNSGEDWNDVNVILSTAKPGVGGAPPKLTTKYINSYRRESERLSTVTENPLYSAPQQTMMNNAIHQVFMNQPVYPSQSVGMATVQDTGHTCTYSIQRKYTLESDGKPHKVTIGISQLLAEFNYESVPRLQAEAFLKASIKNISNGTFLPGDMSIFMDGNFVSKSEMKLVNPDEKFTIFLGADSGVKVEHRPLGSHNDTNSYLFKTKKCLNVKSKIIIKNFKKNPIKIAVYEQLPKSTEGEVKVTLVSPELSDSNGKEENEPVMLTEANNVRWWQTLEPGDEKTFHFEYNVEYGKNIALSMDFI